MNEGLKSIVASSFSIVKLVVDLVENKGTTSAITDLSSFSATMPNLLAHYSTIKTEFEALQNAENEEDLIAYIMSQFSSITPSNAKALKVVEAAVSLGSGVILNTYALVKAVKG
jgi:hypothetical protein